MANIANVSLRAPVQLTLGVTPLKLVDGLSVVDTQSLGKMNVDSDNNVTLLVNEIVPVKYDTNIVVDYDDLTGAGLPQPGDLIYDTDTQEIAILAARTTDTTGSLNDPLPSGAVTTDAWSSMDMTTTVFTSAVGTLTPVGDAITVDQTARTSLITTVGTDINVDFDTMPVGVVAAGGAIRTKYNTLGATVTTNLGAKSIIVDATAAVGTITVQAVTGDLNVDMTAVGVGNEISTIGTDISTLGVLPPLNSFILNAAGTEYRQLISRDSSGLWGAIDSAFTVPLVGDSSTYCAATNALPVTGSMIVIGATHALLVRTNDLFGTTDPALTGAGQAYGYVLPTNFLPAVTDIIEVGVVTDTLAVRTDGITGTMTTGFANGTGQTMNWDVPANKLPLVNTYVFDPFLLGTTGLTVHELNARTNDFRGTVTPAWNITTPGFVGYIADTGLPLLYGSAVISGGDVRRVTALNPIEGTISVAFPVDLTSDAWTYVPIDGLLPNTGSIIGINNGGTWEFSLLETNVDGIAGTISAATAAIIPSAWEYINVGDVDFVARAGTISVTAGGDITLNVPTGNTISFNMYRNNTIIDSRVCYAETSTPVNIHMSGISTAMENDNFCVKATSTIDGATIDLFDHNVMVEILD